MQKVALITGASNGIGLELARVHAQKSGNLVLVARNIEKLISLKLELESKYGITVFNIQKDLTLKNSAREVFDEIKRHNIVVDYLVNNAGIGDFGWFADRSWEVYEKMIDLNIKALVELTKLFVDEMKIRGTGRILNVASTASFQPGPTMAVYCATKAFVLSFSEAINNELLHTGITVTSLCPGPTQSGFMDVANLNESKFIKGKKIPTSREVAQYGYKAMLNGKDVAIHGFKNRLMVFSERFTPRWLVVKIVRMMMEK